MRIERHPSSQVLLRTCYVNIHLVETVGDACSGTIITLFRCLNHIKLVIVYVLLLRYLAGWFNNFSSDCQAMASWA
jgi:hypothetical protein